MAGKPRAPPRRSLRSQKQQTRLAFSPLPSSSPARDGKAKAMADRFGNVYEDERSSPVKHDFSAFIPVADAGLLTPEPSSQVLPHRDENSTSSVIEKQPSASAQPSSSQCSEDEDEDPIQHSAKRRRIHARGTPVRRSGRLMRSPSTQRYSSDASRHVKPSTATHGPQDRRIGLSDIGSPETTGDEADMFMPTQQRRRLPVKTRISHQSGGRTKSARDDFVADDDEVDFKTSDDEQPSSSKVSRGQRRPKKSRHRTRDEQEELDADLEDLLDSGNEDVTQTKRTRGGPVTTKRDQAKEHFALLKRRRAGEKIPRIQDSDDEHEGEEDEEGQNLHLIGQPSQLLLAQRSSHSSEDSDSSPDEKLDEIDDELMATAGEEDDDRFIEEDETSGGGRRPHPDIPIQFTQFASAKPAELFVHVVEWLVKNKLSPAFARHDSLYQLAMDRVDDQIKAQAGSRLISSAWNAMFKYTIMARPNISVEILEGAEDDLIRTCDACNKSNRPARYDFVLTGGAYSRDTLEPVNDSDSEDDGADDDASQDEAGHTLARQRQHFYLGTHCAANAQMGHKLTHWKYHLNEAVLQYLEEQGVLSAESIVARDKLSSKKREKEAEAIVDSMEATGKITQLWKELQSDLDDARLAMEDYQKKGGRSHGMIGVISSTGTDGIRRDTSGRYVSVVSQFHSALTITGW